VYLQENNVTALTNSQEWDTENFDEALFELFTVDMIPFSFMESPRWQRVLRMLKNDVPLRGADWLRGKLVEKHQKMLKEKIGPYLRVSETEKDNLGTCKLMFIFSLRIHSST
jgi:hypothetical protein